jgi:predicted alpha/beta superfamily hydrolase
MIKTILICLFFGLLVSCVPDQDATANLEDQQITIGKKFSIDSEILGEVRSYWVYLPASYNGNASAPKDYPVMYLLDGDAHFQSASGVVQFMSSGINGNVQIPELIVVAIPNTNRTRDLTPTHSLISFDGEEAESLKDSGGGNAFLKFVRDELFSEIDSTYRTAPHRTLVGHSLGGLITLHALLDVPDMFQSYIAIDPSLWWDDTLLVRQAEDTFANDHARRGSVYISLANNSNSETGEPSLMEEAGRQFASILASAGPSAIRSELQYFAAEDHGSVPLISLYHGLLSTFEGYKFQIGDFISKPSIASVIAHFEGVSERLGIDTKPPESLVNQLGYLLLYTIEDLDMAAEMLELNVTNYPASSNVYDSLGEAYMVSGDTILAVDNYEKSLLLDPDNENAKQQLEKLNAQQEMQ